MPLFVDISKLISKVKILVYGSYHPDNLPILVNLVSFLKEKGFINTFLAKELIKIPQELKSENKNAFIYNEIKKKMLETDFNIFILFYNKNDSVIVELSSLVDSENFEEKYEKTLVNLPFDYDYTIVKGLISEYKLNIFRYNNEFELEQFCFSFIKRNLIK